MTAWEIFEAHPYISFAAAMLALAAPRLRANRLRPDDPTHLRVSRYEGMLVAVALGCAVVLALRYLIVARPLIESVDFFYYVVRARDRLQGLTAFSPAQFAYFPGVYVFWEAVMALCGKDLATLQWAFVLLLAANAALVAAIVATTVRDWRAGALAALWYLALASRFEGLYGTTEPIATLFALAGVYCWGGLPLRGAAGWRRMLLLAAGLGLALWSKQQGGLVSVGAVALLANYAIAPPPERHCLRQLVLLPIVAASVFLAALLLEGHGLLPIRIGLAVVADYETKGTALDNLAAAVRQTGFAGWCGFLALLLWVGTLLTPRLRLMHRERWMAIVGFALFAGLATLAQFSKRAYLHYALLLAPFLSIAAVTTAIELARKLSATSGVSRSIAGALTAGILCVPLIASGYGDSYFHAWPPAWNPPVAHETPWHTQPDVASDLAAIGTLVAPGEDLLVIPLRREAVHFLFGSRATSTPPGWFADASVYDALKSPTLGSVLIVDSRVLDATDAKTCVAFHCTLSAAALTQHGFAKVAERKTMTLWRRPR